jgi:hypothetical protein
MPDECNALTALQARSSGFGFPAGGVTKAGDVLGVAPYLADSLADWLYSADRQRVVTGHTKAYDDAGRSFPCGPRFPRYDGAQSGTKGAAWTPRT